MSAPGAPGTAATPWRELSRKVGYLFAISGLYVSPYMRFDLVDEVERARRRAAGDRDTEPDSYCQPYAWLDDDADFWRG